MLQLLKERRFTSVLCIDDENATPAIDSIESLASAFVEANARKRRRLANDDHFFSEAVPIADRTGVDTETKKADVRGWLENQDPEELSSDRLRRAADVLLQGRTGPTFERLRKQLRDDGIDLRPLSFGQWLSEGKALLEGAKDDARVLLLVDEVNDKEPHVDLDGQRLLSDVLATQGDRLPHIDAIMVTSNCAPEDELEESQKVYEEISKLLTERNAGQPYKKVFVLSKERLEDHTLVESFEWHLNRIEASRLSIQLADATKNILGNALNDSLDWLKRIPLLEFHHSIFVTAANEGAAEIDTLVRLASIRQRVALEKVLREDGEVRRCIEEMRKVTTTGLGAGDSPPSSSWLRELREQEFERPGDHVNLLRAPLACGDVFRLVTTDAGGNPHEFTAMLLVNPCDLVIRKDGKRKLTTGLLVEVSKLTRQEAEQKASAEKSAPPLTYRLATGNAADDIVYVFQNSRVESIPLTVLDLCWTSSSGKAEINPKELSDSVHALTPPQQLRVENILLRNENDKFSRIEVWGHDLPVDRTRTEKTKIGQVDAHWAINYPLARVWRLAPEFAAAALAALAQSLARPSFGHDYRQH
ncbi:hypothetical protein KOL96_07975 [Ralstonia wenshanensis]|uniref:hypothetical protein n=1 Tax=Ralstonia wenshanensis TaxID=2842456 RepID=UPI001E5CAAF6|nr:hypothetical protein [Ralstonia wenshanensis]UGS91061.1 hypothetical protein KOL96_07975 [Ralstonia wenshanensis]